MVGQWRISKRRALHARVGVTYKAVPAAWEVSVRAMTAEDKDDALV